MIRARPQFVDMCMLCGCDYLEPLKGIGAKTALKLVREHDDMESILEHLRKGKNPPPEDWPYEEARQLFMHPEVQKASEIDVSLRRPGLSPLNLVLGTVGEMLVVGWRNGR